MSSGLLLLFSLSLFLPCLITFQCRGQTPRLLAPFFRCGSFAHRTEAPGGQPKGPTPNCCIARGNGPNILTSCFAWTKRENAQTADSILTVGPFDHHGTFRHIRLSILAMAATAFNRSNEYRGHRIGSDR